MRENVELIYVLCEMTITFLNDGNVLVKLPSPTTEDMHSFQPGCSRSGLFWFVLVNMGKGQAVNRLCTTFCLLHNFCMSHLCFCHCAFLRSESWLAISQFRESFFLICGFFRGERVKCWRMFFHSRVLSHTSSCFPIFHPHHLYLWGHPSPPALSTFLSLSGWNNLLFLFTLHLMRVLTGIWRAGKL